MWGRKHPQALRVGRQGGRSLLDENLVTQQNSQEEKNTEAGGKEEKKAKRILLKLQILFLGIYLKLAESFL
jgi:hypothetical protein